MNGYWSHDFTSQLASLPDWHLDVNALPTRLSENQNGLRMLHCEASSNLALKFERWKAENSFQNKSLQGKWDCNLVGFVIQRAVWINLERIMLYLFVSDWWLWHTWHDILLPGLSDGAVSWHITKYTCIPISIHSASCYQTDGFAALLLTRNCFNACIQNTM